jgi:hypothetical protein
MLFKCSSAAARLPCCRKTEQTMTINQAFEVVEAKLNAADIHFVNPSGGGTFPLNSQYFGRYRSDVLQIRVSDHPSKYPRHACVHIILRDGISEIELSGILDGAIRELSDMEDKLAREEGTI